MTWPTKAPKGKLPYMDLFSAEASDSGSDTTKVTTIADSQLILQHLVSAGLCRDLDEPLTPSERGDSRAWIAYTEELMYPALVTTRWYWGREDNYTANFAKLPLPAWLWPPFMRRALGWFFRRHVSNTLWTAGIARHDAAEVNKFIKEWIDNVSTGLEGSKSGWRFGREEPTTVDVVLHAMLANIVATGDGNREALEMVREKKVLLEFLRRGTELWFPEYEGILQFVKSSSGISA